MNYKLNICLALFFAVPAFPMDFSKLGDFVFESQTPQLFDGAFILPNEYKTNEYGAYLQEESGVLVIPGSFRAFITFALGNFSHAIFVDFDGGIVEFNKALAELILAIHRSEKNVSFQRYQFLSVFKGLWLDYWELEHIVAKATQESDRIRILMAKIASELSHFDKFSKSAPNEIQIVLKRICDFGKNKIVRADVAKDYIPRMFKYLEKFYPADIKRKLMDYKYCENKENIKSNENERNIKRRKINAKNEFVDSPPTKVVPKKQFLYFWEDDNEWLKLVNAIKEKRIAIISRDISSPQFLKELKDCLTHLKSPLQVLDVSNILMNPKFMNQSQKQQLSTAMAELPKSPNGMLFFTSRRALEQPAVTLVAHQDVGITWHYYFMDLMNIDLINTL